MEDVTFIIPAYNEESNIDRLLTDITSLYSNSSVIVIDNNSNDRTVEIAKKYPVKVLSEKKQGKGNAIRTGFKAVQTDYAIMLDADNTYDPKEAKSLLEPLFDNNNCHIVLGSRLNGKKENGAITKFNIIGNHLLSLTASILYSPISDMCTGYWALKKEVIEYFLKNGIASNGFELEAEMFVKASKNKYKFVEVPIKYRKRSDIPKLNSISDGWIILKTLLLFKIKHQSNDLIDDSLTNSSKARSK